MYGKVGEAAVLIESMVLNLATATQRRPTWDREVSQLTRKKKDFLCLPKNRSSCSFRVLPSLLMERISRSKFGSGGGVVVRQALPVYWNSNP